MPGLRVFVVDDEAPARRKILRFLKADPEVQVVGEASNGKQALTSVPTLHPELLFLDVQMPGLDGFDVVEALSSSGEVPQVVFVTAHDQYAVRAFEVHALDYLLKPFDEERFARVMARAKKQVASGSQLSSLQKLLSLVRPAAKYQQRLFVRENDRAFFVPTESILWIESARNYVVLHAKERNHILRGTLDALEEQLDPAYFLRLNRSTLARINSIRELKPWFHGEYKVKLEDGSEIRWSRLYVRKRPELVKPV
jgi:two-component system LytT family response regulator